MNREQTINENWKTVKGYPMYEVSDLGNVRSLNYRRTGKGQVLKQSDNNSGYKCVVLTGEDGNPRRMMVHRLVADAFIENPLEKPYVDHINTEKDDNRAVNLKWVTASENSRNPITLARTQKAAKEKAEYLAQTVYVYTEDLKLLTAYTSTSVAALRTGLSQGNIARCCMGELRRYKGLIYSYIPINNMRERLEVEESQEEKRQHILRINERNMKKWLEIPENRQKVNKKAMENYYKRKERRAS